MRKNEYAILHGEDAAARIAGRFRVGPTGKIRCKIAIRYGAESDSYDVVCDAEIVGRYGVLEDGSITHIPSGMRLIGLTKNPRKLIEFVANHVPNATVNDVDALRDAVAEFFRLEQLRRDEEQLKEQLRINERNARMDRIWSGYEVWSDDVQARSEALRYRFDFLPVHVGGSTTSMDADPIFYVEDWSTGLSGSGLPGGRFGAEVHKFASIEEAKKCSDALLSRLESMEYNWTVTIHGVASCDDAPLYRRDFANEFDASDCYHHPRSMWEYVEALCPAGPLWVKRANLNRITIRQF